MDDIEEIPVETTAGDRPTSTVGDRMLIGLAALALLGGALIAIGNLVGNPDDAVAAASPGASAAASTSRSARPTPTQRALRELTVEPGEPEPIPVADRFLDTYWVQGEVELPVRDEPRDGAALVLTIPAGDVILAEPIDMFGDEWLFVQEPRGGGYVRVVDASGVPVAVLRPVPQGFQHGYINGLAAGASGFVAAVVPPGAGAAPLETVTAFSEDGTRWTTADGAPQFPWGRVVIAWGPSGWLAATTLPGRLRAAAWIWESADGSHWTPLGALETGDDGWVSELWATADGYMMVLVGAAGGVPWFSPDGITWQEGTRPYSSAWPDDGPLDRMLATPHGFLMWRHTRYGASRPAIALTRDARNWIPIDVEAPELVSLELALAGDSLLGLGRGRDGQVRALRGQLGPDGGSLAIAPDLEDPFAGAVVTAVASDGTRAHAFGYRRSGGAGRAWVSDGAGWRALALPPGGLGGVVRHAVAGPRGLLAVGASFGPLVSAPRLWHLPVDGAWRPEARPVVPNQPAPEPLECPPLPETGLDFMSLDPAIAVACFGNRPMSVTLYSAPCSDCPATPRATAGAGWLDDPVGLTLLPYQGTGDRGWWRLGVPEPGFELQAEHYGNWLRLTGHFADPDSVGCASAAPMGDEDWWLGPDEDVHTCQRMFVVTEATVVERPG